MTAPAKRSLVINVKIDGLRETLRAFNALPKDASNELRDEAMAIADDMAGWIRAGALAESRTAARVAGTLKVRRDRVPVVEIGGASKVGTGTGRQKGKAFQLLFGANFGARQYSQFKAWAGRGNDFFVFKQIEGHQSEIERRYYEAVDRVIARWSQSTID